MDKNKDRGAGLQPGSTLARGSDPLDEARAPYDIITELYAYHDRLAAARDTPQDQVQAVPRHALGQSDQILLAEIEDMLKDPQLARIARPVFRDALGWVAERALQISTKPNI